MSPIDQLVPLLKKLRPSGVLQSLELRLRRADASVDRLLQDAQVIPIEGDSYRNPPSRRHSHRATDNTQHQEVTASRRHTAIRLHAPKRPSRYAYLPLR